jgi:hypothetical protein
MLSQTLRITLFGAGAAVLLVLGSLQMRAPEGAIAPQSNLEAAVYVINSVPEYHAATSTGRVILFVDCGWNGDVGEFRNRFQEFAGGWCRNETSIRPVTVMLDADDQNALWDTLQKLWDDLGVSSGGLKNLGGAGRIVWFEDGEVQDIAWCHHLPDVAGLRERTQELFD